MNDRNALRMLSDLPPITRSTDHRYTHAGVTVPGVTGILKVLDKSGPLMNWAARMTAEAFVATIDDIPKLIQTVGPEGVVKAMTARSAWKNDEAKDLGTDVHEIADRINRGEDSGPMTPAVAERVELYRGWWNASGWTLRLSEAYVVDVTGGYGGTFDILARDRDGRTVLADIKTGKGVYRETILQLAAYGMAPVVCPAGSPKSYPMPAVDRYVVVHVTAKGVREIEVNVGDADRTAFWACKALADWSDAQKGKPL